jgi:hypothetical protein
VILITKQQQLQELYTDWNELEAYRRLQDESFDFGTGLIINDSTESEDVYYKISQWNIDDYIDYLEDNCYFKKKSKYFKYRGNYYQNKVYDKEYFKILQQKYWWTVYEKNMFQDDEPHYLLRNWFATNTRRYYKKYSNHCVRKNKHFGLKGNSYRKVFNYWSMIW